MMPMRDSARWRSGVIAGVLVGLLAQGGSGCSFAFVRRAPPRDQTVQKVDCTTNYVAPIVDSVLAVLGGVVTLAGNSVCLDSCGDRTGKTLVLAIPFFIIPAGSAVYGYATVSGCRSDPRR